MTAESEQKGLPVFDNLSDIRAMEEFRDAYRNVFLGQEALTQSHREIPDWLAINHVKEPPKWLKFLDDKSVGYLPRQLAVSQLKPAHFDDVAESYTVSINQNLTASAIGLGLNYIDHVEQSAWNRKTWQPFEFIHRPAYYLITLISERLRDLCRFEPTKALVQEYRCLFLFLDRAVRIASDYFSTHEDVEPFHCYLSDVAYVVSQMKLRLEFYLERTAMAKNLENIANLLDAYRAGLAIYLAYAISDAPLNEAVHLGQLLPFKKKVRSEKAQTLPTEFRNSRIYRNINRVLEGKSDCIVNKTRVENKGVSSLLKKSAEEGEKAQRAINNTLAAYHELLLSLSLLPELIRGLRTLSDGTKLQGEYEIVHDEGLYATLEIQLTLSIEFLAQSSQRYDKINEQNRYVLYGNENFQRGSTLNIRSAQRQSERLTQIGRPILENRQAIRERIQKIQQLNPDTLKAQRNALLKRTNRLLTQFQRYGILPTDELTKLQKQLQSAYPREDKENPRVFSRPIAVSASTAGRCIELENNKQDSVTMRQTPTQDGNASTDNNNRYPFPEIYAAFKNQPNADQLCQQFDELIGKLSDEIDVALPKFIAQLEKICDLAERLEQDLEKLDGINSCSLSSSDFAPAFDNFKRILALRQQVHYSSIIFTNFSILNEIFSKYHAKFRDQLINQIVELLPEDMRQATAKGRVSQAQEMRLSIVDYCILKLKSVKTRINELKKKSESMLHWSEGNLTDYYRNAIQLRLQRLPEHERPRFNEPEQVISESNTPVIAPISITPFNNTQEQPKIIPATREEVFQAFESIQVEVKKPAILPKKAKKPKLLDKLSEKCSALFKEDITAEQLKSGLNGLVIFLLDIHYHLHGGGEWVISPTTKESKKVPYAIKLMAAQYTQRITEIKKMDATGLVQLTELRNTLFSEIGEALENPPVYFCFYNPRDPQTQAIYQTMVECYKQQSKPAINPAH